MARQYNYIYRELVEDDNDIVGHIAYSLYKSDKIKFIADFKSKHEGQEPSEEELMHFHEICCIQSNIDRYKMQAVSILQQFMSDTLSATTKQIEEDYKKSQDKHLAEIVAPLVPKFGRNILQSIIGAFIFALIVAGFAFIKTYNANDVNITFGNKRGQTIEKTIPTDTVATNNTTKQWE